LGVGQEDKRAELFRNIYSLYVKRSKVVHGNEVVDLGYTEIHNLQENGGEAIKRLVYIDKEKKEFLELLDQRYMMKKNEKS